MLCFGSVVENTDVKGPRDLEELVFPPASLFGGKLGEYSICVGGFRNYCSYMPMVTPKNFGREVVLRVVPSYCIEGCQRSSSELLVKQAASHLC